ncbi:hypothetical protein [Aestuariivirga sp.]|jgi:hypothetical protein|uniref:hypothetical protein n=1 Tax=Aestuariivirga sp. TaxID=2650926 RepID=UPI0037834B24
MTHSTHLPETVDPAAGTMELHASDFLLDPDCFVDRCVKAHPGANEVFTPAQRSALAEAIRFGRPRMEVVEAVRGYACPPQNKGSGQTEIGVGRQLRGFVVLDELENFAPGDDECFIRQVYEQAFDRFPTEIEMINAGFDLRSGLTRREFINKALERVPRCRSADRSSSAIPGAGLDEHGKMYFSLIKPAAGGNWSIPPHVYLQPVPTRDGFLQTLEGFVLHGPKQSFAPGNWSIAVDIVQPDEARVILDVCANCGLDMISKMTLVGPARFQTAFVIEPWHHFLEVRLYKENAPEALRKLRVRELVLQEL